MKTFLVKLEDGNHFTTGFNGTLDEASAYYLGKAFNFGDTEERPSDVMIKAVSVEEIREGK